MQKPLRSLLEIMYEYQVGDLLTMMEALTNACRDFSTSDQLEQPICTDIRLQALAVVLDGVATCANNFMTDAFLLEQIMKLRFEILRNEVDRREAVLKARLDVILEGVKHNLGVRKFMYVPQEQAEYWNSMFQFGDEFLEVFSHAAKRELVETGNCYAAGRWTACVFHSMRLAEHGLRKLAKSLRVTIKDNGKIYKIEFGDWNKVITAIKGKIAKARTRPRGPKREQELQFYSDMADHCEYMKDIWRNEVAHTRRFYEKPEALSTFNRVKEFTQLLAGHYANKKVKTEQS